MKLKKIRKDLGITQRALAIQLETTQQTVARWESGKTRLNLDQIFRICDVLECSHTDLVDLRGLERTQTRNRNRLSISDTELWGVLEFATIRDTHKFPITATEKKRVSKQLKQRGPGFQGSEMCDSMFWLNLRTLNNKHIFINSRYIRSISLNKKSKQEAPSYQSPEVYEALFRQAEISSNKSSGTGVAQIAEIGEETLHDPDVLKAQNHIRIEHINRKIEWIILTKTKNYSTLMEIQHNPDIAKTTFLSLEENLQEGFYFYNLDYVTHIEAPTQALLYIAQKI